MSIPLLRAVALTAAFVPALAAAAPLTLDQAIERAVEWSQSTRAAAAGVTAARELAHAAPRSFPIRCCRPASTTCRRWAGAPSIRQATR